MSEATIHPPDPHDGSDAATQKLVTNARRLLESGGSHDGVVALLRANGLEKGRSIFFIARHLGMKLGEAKELVHLSPIWQDRRAQDEVFHDQLWQALEAIAEDDDSFTLG